MTDKTKNIVWIAWQRWPRNMWIAKALNIKLYEIDSSHRLRYLMNIIETVKILNKDRPSVIIAMFPSIFLTLFLLIIKWKYGYKLVVDLHTIVSTFQSLKSIRQKIISKTYNVLFIHLLRNSDMIIVTNQGYRKKLLSINKNVFVLPDNIPKYLEPLKKKLEGRFNLLYICSYSQDEPYEEILSLDDRLENDLRIYITGDFTRSRNKIEKSKYKKIIFTGYLSDKEYIRMLHSVDCSIVLTNYEDCLVCGAYESIGAGTPLILSNKKALSKYFVKGVVYTENREESILEAIRTMRTSKEMYSSQIKELKNELKTAYKQKIEELTKALTEL